MKQMRKPPLLKTVFKWMGRSLVLIISIFLAWSLIPLKETVKPLQPRPDTRYWTLADGHKIAYTRVNGDSSKAHSAIVFLHGGPGGYIHSAIIRQMKAVAQGGYDIYLYDQIGSGLSDRLPKPRDYSFDRHLKNLSEIIDRHIPSEKVILIGHSYGGILATHYTANYPEKIEKLILSSPGDLQPYRLQADGTMTNLQELYPIPQQLKFKNPLEVFGQTEKDFLQPRVIMSMLCAMAFNFKWASDKEFDGYTNTMASKFTKGMVADPNNVKPEEGGVGGYAHGFSNYYGNLQDIRSKLIQLTIPTLVLQGQYDQGAYASVYEYADLLKGRYVFIENAGHIIWWDQPDKFNSEIIQFLTAQKTIGRVDTAAKAEQL